MAAECGYFLESSICNERLLLNYIQACFSNSGDSLEPIGIRF